MRKPIKFDLRLNNGTQIATLEQLKKNLTPEIFKSFRSGKLAQWLRVRSLNEQAEAVEALLTIDVKNKNEVQLFKKLREIFECEVYEDDAREMIENYKASLASSNNEGQDIVYVGTFGGGYYFTDFLDTADKNERIATLYGERFTTAIAKPYRSG